MLSSKNAHGITLAAALLITVQFYLQDKFKLFTINELVFLHSMLQKHASAYIY